MRHSETASMKIDTINVSHWYQESCSNYKHISDKWEIYPSDKFLYCCIFKIDIINVSYYYHTTFSRVKNLSSKWESSRPCSSPSTHDSMCFCFLNVKKIFALRFRLALTQLFLDTVRDIEFIASSLLQCHKNQSLELPCINYKLCKTQTSS